MKTAEKQKYSHIENLENRISKVEKAIKSTQKEISRTQDLIDSKKSFLASIQKETNISTFQTLFYKLTIIINRVLVKFFNYCLDLLTYMYIVLLSYDRIRDAKISSLFHKKRMIYYENINII